VSSLYSRELNESSQKGRKRWVTFEGDKLPGKENRNVRRGREKGTERQRVRRVRNVTTSHLKGKETYLHTVF
jgi:hypothetical protein